MLRRTRLDPVLQTKRDAILAEEQDDRDLSLQSYKKWVSLTKNLHTSLLFTTKHGPLILKCICRSVTCNQASTYNTNWKDLAAKLGYNDLEIKCISNLQGQVYDPTEQILQYCAATKDSTVGDLLEALLELGFRSALEQAQEHLEGFIYEVESKHTYTKTDEKENSIKAAHYKPFVPIIFDSLPSKMKTITAMDTNYIVARTTESVQMARPQPPKQNKAKLYCKFVMLSFAADGKTTAEKVARVLRETKNKKGHPVGVIMLSENDDTIQANCGKFIRSLLPQMDFIVPVLTEGYFAALKNPNPQARLMDERFIHYIHDNMTNKYIQNKCLNDQVRPVIPRTDVNNICNKQEFIFDPLLQPWKSDNDLTSLALNILKSRRIKSQTS